MPFDAALFQMKCHRRECRKAAKFIGSCEEIDGRTTEKFMGAGFFGVEAEQHVSSFDDVPERAAQSNWAKMAPYVSGVYTMLIL